MKNDIMMKCATPMKLSREPLLVNQATIYKIYFINLIILASCLSSFGQSITVVCNGPKTNLRGLCVVSDKIVWVSGSAGKVGISSDSGSHFKWIDVKGYEKTDFRDIEAFDENTAIIMGIDSPGVILKTKNAGASWAVVYINKERGIFLDAMDFKGKHGVVIGDPIDGQFVLATTKNKGDSWQQQTWSKPLKASYGEAAFASSGTNIRLLNNKQYIFVSGGLASLAYIKGAAFATPIIQGTTSTGANSVACGAANQYMIVGGDFNAKNDSTKNCFITNDGGISWQPPNKAPMGYRSCVEYLGLRSWLTCGLNGVDISSDNGYTFTNISTLSFNTCKQAKKGNAIYLVGSNGRVGKIISN